MEPEVGVAPRAGFLGARIGTLGHVGRKTPPAFKRALFKNALLPKRPPSGGRPWALVFEGGAKTRVGTTPGWSLLRNAGHNSETPPR